MLAALSSIALPLVASICLESVVAVLFGFRRELAAIAWVNLITNPLLNLVWLSLFWLGFGRRMAASDGATARVVPSLWMWFLLAGMEVVVILAEWRLLLMALGRQKFSGRKLLTVSLAMNAVSATLGTFLLGRLG